MTTADGIDYTKEVTAFSLLLTAKTSSIPFGLPLRSSTKRTTRKAFSHYGEGIRRRWRGLFRTQRSNSRLTSSGERFSRWTRITAPAWSALWRAHWPESRRSPAPIPSTWRELEWPWRTNTQDTGKPNLESFKQKRLHWELNSTKLHFRSLTHVFMRIWIDEGPKTLFRGFWATIVGVIPYAGTSFFTFETLKRKHKGKSVLLSTNMRSNSYSYSLHSSHRIDWRK